MLTRRRAKHNDTLEGEKDNGRNEKDMGKDAGDGGHKGYTGNGNEGNQGQDKEPSTQPIHPMVTRRATKHHALLDTPDTKHNGKKQNKKGEMERMQGIIARRIERMERMTSMEDIKDMRARMERMEMTDSTRSMETYRSKRQRQRQDGNQSQHPLTLLPVSPLCTCIPISSKPSPQNCLGTRPLV
jgi:hypothetical protein